MNVFDRIVTVVVVLVIAIIGFSYFFPYKIEEAIGGRYPIAVEWAPNFCLNVSFVLIGMQDHADKFSDPDFSDPRYSFKSIDSGDVVRIVELVSGFNNTRFAHEAIVLEIEAMDNAIHRLVIPVTPELIRNRKLVVDTEFGDNAG